MNEQVLQAKGTITETRGDVIVVRPGKEAVLVEAGFQLQKNDILLTPRNSDAVIEVSNELFLVDQNCVGCIDVFSYGEPQFSIAAVNSEIVAEPSESALDGGFDIDALQAAILAGEDPTAVLEAPAAGGDTAGGTANGGFASIPFNYTITSPSTYFQTSASGAFEQSLDEDDSNIVSPPLGGTTVTTTVTEGSLSDGTYPQVSVAEATILPGTLALDSTTFAPTADSLSTLLSELNSEVTSSGQAVVFSYDAAVGTISGVQDGNTVLTIDLDFVQDGPNVALTLTTTVEMPIDHNVSNGSSGSVRFTDNLLELDLAIQGEDVIGNQLIDPIALTVSVADGADQTALQTDETFDEDNLSLADPSISGDLFDIGSDAIQDIRFDASVEDAGFLSGVYSNNNALEVSLSSDGRTLTVHVQGDPTDVVLEAVVKTDGTYTVTPYQSFEQSQLTDILSLSFPVTSVDYDGDTVTNNLIYNVEDGQNAQVTSASTNLNITEPASGSSASHTGSVGFVQGSDVIESVTWELSTEARSFLESLTSNDNPTTLDTSDPTQIKVIDSQGDVALLLTIDDLAGSYTVTQGKPLDQDSFTSSSLGLVLVATDADGDTTEARLNLSINDFPTITTSPISQLDINEGAVLDGSLVNAATNTATVGFVEGSDAIVTVDWVQNAATDVALDTITSRGQATKFEYNDGEIRVYIEEADGSTTDVITFSVNPDNSGSYTVTQYLPIDQNLDTDGDGDSDALSIPLTIQATDSDGTTATASITVTTNDGDSTQLQVTTATLTETLDASGDFVVAQQTGNVVDTLGVDGISDFSTSFDATQISGWTSQGLALSVVEGDNSYSIVRTESDDSTTEVMSFVLNDDGTYSVIQSQPLDQDDGVSNQLVFGVTASSTDDADVSTTVTVNLNDGIDTTISDEPIRFTEQSNDSGFVATELNGQLDISYGTDGVKSLDLAVDDTTSSQAWTSEGKPLTFADNGNGYDLVYVNDNGDTVKVLEVILDTDGSYTVKQNLPIDQPDSGTSELSFTVNADLYDGETTSKLTIDITDGGDASVTDSEVTLTESLVNGTDTFSVASVSGDTQLEYGSDNADVSIALNNAAEVAGWTSNGEATSIDTSTENTIKLLDSDGNNLLVFVYNADGTYDVTQYGPIDQLPDSENVQLDVLVTATSTDDATTTANITVNLKDGADPVVTTSVDAALTEGNAAVTYNNVLNIKGTDDIESVDISLASDSSFDVSQLTSSGQALEVANTDGDVYQLVIAGTSDVVLTVSLDKETNQLTVDQTLPLDHPADNTIELKFDVTVTDTDNDTGSTSFNLTLTDGTDPSIEFITAVEVRESDLTGSATASTQVNLGDSSDKVTSIDIDISNISAVDATGQTSTLQSGGHDVQFEVDADGDSYTGYIEYTDETNQLVRKDVVQIEVNSDPDSSEFGKVDVTLLAPVDHASSGSDTTSLLVPFTATDIDGDTSDAQNLTVNIVDQTPELNDLTVKLTEGTSSAAQNMFADQGADLADIETLQITDTNFRLEGADSSGRFEPEYGDPVVVSMQVDGNWQNIGEITLTKSSSGVIESTFEAYRDVYNADGDVVFDLTVVGKDHDGDADQSTISVTVSDGAAASVGNTNSSVSLSENSLLTPATDSVQFTEGSDSIASVEWVETAELISALSSITTQGEGTVYDVDGYTITVSTTDGQPVLTFELNADNSGEYTVTQHLPIDQGAENQTDISLTIKATDSDNTETVATAKATIADGNDTVLQAGEESLTEVIDSTTGAFVPATETGDVVKTTGVDGISDFSTSFDATQISGWTSQGLALSVVEGDNSYSIVRTESDGSTTEVMSFVLNDDGTYSVTQSQPLDQKDGVSSQLVFGVIAKSTDDDDVSTTVTVNLNDGIDTSIADEPVSFTEQSNNDGFVATELNGQLDISYGTDGVKSLDLTVDDTTSSQTWTSEGKPLTFVDNGNGYDLVYDDNGTTVKVLEVILDTDGSYTVKQNLPIDQPDGNISELSFTVNNHQFDGETTSKLTISIKDGAEATLIGSEVTLTESLIDGTDTFKEVSASGDVKTTYGSDNADISITLNNAEEVAGWTSNGKAISIDTSTENTIKLLDSDGNNLLVFVYTENSNNTDGKYEVTQYGPIDQLPDSESVQLDVLVTAASTDDNDVTANIKVNLKDGADPVVTTSVDAALTEGNAAVTYNDVLDIKGTDDIASVDVSLASDSSFDLSQLTSSGQALEVADTNSDVYQLVIAGTNDVVLTVSLDKDTNQLTVDQTLPLDHPADNTIELKFDVTVTDTDNDTGKTSFDLTLTDGTEPSISVIDRITVDESGIGNRQDTSEKASGTISLNTSSDNIESVDIDINNIVITDASGNAIAPLYSNGKEVEFKETSSGYIGYVTKDNGKIKTVIEIKISDDDNSDGSVAVDVKLRDELDHLQQGEDTITLQLPVTVTDFDGDESPSQNMYIDIVDQVPVLRDITISMTEGKESKPQNVFKTIGPDNIDEIQIESDDPANFRLGGSADGDAAVSITDFPAQISVFMLDSSGSWQEIGQLTVTKNSRGVTKVSFDSEESIDHGITDEIIASFTVKGIDGDGDIVDGDLTLKISDKSAEVVTSSAVGLEDAGRNGNAPIAVSLLIDIHDADADESVSKLKLTDPEGGSFYYLKPGTSSEFIKIDNHALTDEQLDITSLVSAEGTDQLSIDNIYFIPDVNFSTDAGGINANFKVWISRENVVPDEKINGQINIEVKGVADTPTFNSTDFVANPTGSEDSENIPLNFKAETVDQTDSSAETITYELSFDTSEYTHTLVDQNGDIIQPDSDGVYRFEDSDSGNVFINPADNFSGVIEVTVKATSTEPNSNAAQATAVSTETISVDVAASADETSLSVNRVRATEDVPFELDDYISIKDSVDADGSETLYVQITGLPEGALVQNINADGDTAIIIGGVAVLADSNGNPVDADGNPVTEQADYVSVDLQIAYDLITGDTSDVNTGGLKTSITPPADSNDNFTFSVKAVVEDEAALSNGRVSQSSYETDVKSIAVSVKGVADAPEIVGGIGWTSVSETRTINLADGSTQEVELNGVETTIDENGEAVLDFNVTSGEVGNDGSETISVVLSSNSHNIADYTIYDESGNQVNLVYVGQENGEPKYEANISSGAIRIVPADNVSEDIYLKAKIVVTENDGDESITYKDIVVNVDPVADGIKDGYNIGSTINEDSSGEIDWYPKSADISDINASGIDNEYISELTLTGIPVDSVVTYTYNGNTASYTVTDNSPLTISADVGGQLTADNLKIYVQPPENSSTDFTVSTTLTVNETGPNGETADPVQVNGSIDVTVRPVVEDDAVISLDATGDANTVVDGDIVKVNTDGSFKVSVNGTGDGADLTVSDSDSGDYASLESIKDVVVTFTNSDGSALSADQLDDLYITNALYNGDGSWLITGNDFEIKAPNGYSGDLNAHFHTRVYDAGEDSNENSILKELDYSAKLQFSDPDPAVEVTDGAASISYGGTAILGVEDQSIDFGTQLMAQLSIENVADIAGDEVTIVITPDEGVAVNGTTVNPETGEYLIKGTITDNGGTYSVTGLDGLTITVPDDFAGDLDVNVRIVTEDTNSGKEHVSETNIPVIVTPVVDEGSSELKILGTTNKDAAQGATDVFISDEALEGGEVALSLNLSVGDSDSDVTEGVESIDSVTITLTQGSGLIKLGETGAPVTELTLTKAEIDSGALSKIIYVPSDLDESETTVELSITGTVTETVDYDLTGHSEPDTATTVDFGTVTFETKPVEDSVQITIADISGSEDSHINLSGATVALKDSDSSEEILSAKLTNVPEGFLVGSGSSDYVVKNNGDGEWSIQYKGSDTGSFDLSVLYIQPLEDFSGTAENISLTVYSWESSNQEPIATTETFNLTVNPVAEVVDSDIKTNLSGVEGETIDIRVNAKVVDNKASYKDTSDADVTENGIEHLVIEVSDVPEGASIYYPNADNNIAVSDGNGTWTITLPALTNGQPTVVDNIQFNSGDNNTDSWSEPKITVDIYAVDNGTKAIPELVTSKEITFDEITPVNDAPTLDNSASYEATEDTAMVITDISISDVDVADSNTAAEFTVTVEIPEGSGALSLLDTTDLDVSQSMATSLVITGSYADITAALANGVEFTPAENFNGTIQADVTVNDGGNNGGEPLEANSQFDINIAAVNDAPELILTDTTVDEAVSTKLTGITVSDVESVDNIQVTLSVDSGSLQLNPGSHSVTVISETDQSITLQGTQEEIQNLLSDNSADTGVFFDSGIGGLDAALTVVVDDLSGEANSVTSDTKTVTVTPVAQAPTLTEPLYTKYQAAISATQTILMPLLGLIPALTDASEELRLVISADTLPAGAAITGMTLDTDNNWVKTITADEGNPLTDLEITGISEGSYDLEIKVESVEENGDSAVSDSFTLSLQAVNSVDVIAGDSSDEYIWDAAGLGMEVTAGDGDDYITGGSGNDVIYGGDGNDVIFGEGGDDILYGGAGNDILTGGEGSDTIYAGLGDDILTGDGEGIAASSDTFVWRASDLDDSTDTIKDFDTRSDTHDTIDLSDLFADAENSQDALDQLLQAVSVSIVDDRDISLNIHHGDHSQTIVLENQQDYLGPDPTAVGLLEQLAGADLIKYE